MWAQRRNKRPLREPVTPSRTVAKEQRTGAPSTSARPGSTLEGPPTELYTPMPPVFSHPSSSQFQYTMAPPTEGFFTSVAPLVVYPPQGLDFGLTYRMVQHTPTGLLFASDLSGSGHHEEDKDDTDTNEDDDEDNTPIRRNLEETVVHQLVGPRDIGDINWIWFCIKHISSKNLHPPKVVTLVLVEALTKARCREGNKFKF
ncbi:hypothetical protein V6N13_141695 [Hibiscus sabdariffa]